MVLNLQCESSARVARMLRTALDPAIASFFEDQSIVEVTLNPDGRLWIDRLSGGLEDTGRTMSAADGERLGVACLPFQSVNEDIKTRHPVMSKPRLFAIRLQSIFMLQIKLSFTKQIVGRSLQKWIFRNLC